MHLHDDESESWDIIYEPDHIEKVLSELHKGFPTYFALFFKSEKATRRTFHEAIEAFEDEQASYQKFLDLQTLEDFALVPNSFKNRIKRDCPIIRRCLNAKEEAMKRYKKDFNLSKGQHLLEVTTNIVKFGYGYVEDFDHEAYETCKTVDDLELWELLEDNYTVFGVIGGGIKSHFLYNLFPYAFPNRSQAAIWALYFLTDKKQFGLKDDTEFLMIDVDRGTTQQNYHYPYDLFGFYTLKLYLLLKEACAKKGYYFDSDYRYIYLDTFLNHVTEQHQDDIAALMRAGQYEFKE